MAINSPEAKKTMKAGKAGMVGPLYSSGSQPSLGAQPVGGPQGGMSTPDPLGFKHGGKKGRKGR